MGSYRSTDSSWPFRGRLLQHERALQVLHCPKTIALHSLHRTTVAVGDGIRGIQIDGLGKIRDGAVEIALGFPGVSAVVEGKGEVRLEPQRVARIGDRFIECTLIK